MMKVSGWISLVDLLAPIGRSWWTIVAGTNAGLTIALAAATMSGTRSGALAVLGVSLLVGLALFVGPVLVRALVEPHVRSRRGLERISGIPVLASLPALDRGAARAMRRRRQLHNALIAVATTLPCVATILMLLRSNTF